MSLFERLKSIFSRKADDSETTSRFIHPRIPVFPNDGEAPLMFPPVLDTPEKKIIYALHARGQQPYGYLRLATEIPRENLDQALKSLVESNRVKKSLLGPGQETDPWVFTMYSLS